MSKKDIFPFSPAFQDQMLCLMIKDLSFRNNILAHIPSDRLHSEAHKWFFKKIEEMNKKEKITYIEIEDDSKYIEKSKRKLYLEFAKRIFNIEIENEAFIKEKMTAQAREYAFVNIFTSAQTSWNAGNREEAFKTTQQGIAELYGINFTNDASIPVQEFIKRRKDFLISSSFSMRKVPTGIDPLDNILYGGIELGEMGILLAEPKKGKSIGLNHFSYQGVISGATVAHFVLEGTTEQAMFRFLSRMSQIDYHRIASDELSLEEARYIDTILARYKNKFHLIPFNQHWSYTPYDVEAKLDELANAGMKPHLAVIDYADLLKSSSPQREKRTEQTEVYRDLKRLAVMKKYALWTASQARRPEDKPELEYLLRAKDISESFEKVRIADFVATLNQTPKEKDWGIMRLHLDIYRSNDMDRTIKLITNYEKMIFYSKKYGHATQNDFFEWMNKKGRR